MERCECFSRQWASMPLGLLGSLPAYFQKKTGKGLSGHSGHCNTVLVQGLALLKCDAILSEKLNSPTTLQ